ncbi:MAG: hypothetical protein WKG01_29360 [Kofleriaceae bacterium]
MRIAWLGLVLVMGCPQKPVATGPSLPTGAGCPTAAGVHVASYVLPEEGAKGHTGWVLPLHDKVVDTVEGTPDFATIDAAAAIAAGVPAAPASLWLLAPGARPCRASLGNYYAAAIASKTPNIAYGIELGGCPAPKDPETASAIVLASSESPGGCQAIAPRSVAQRLGEADKDNRWSRPRTETAIPPVLASAIPARECVAPGCEKLWSIAQVDVGNQPVAWAGAVNWIAIPDAAAPETQCDWKVETFSGFFVAGTGGVPTRVTEGQDHPLALTAVLVDQGGARVLVAEGPGEYSTYDLAAGKATLGRHLVWLRPDDESYAAIDHLGPGCP